MAPDPDSQDNPHGVPPSIGVAEPVLSIGGLAVSLEYLAHGRGVDLEPIYARFLSDQDPDFSLRIRRGLASDLSLGKALFSNPSSPWALHESGGEFAYAFYRGAQGEARKLYSAILLRKEDSIGHLYLVDGSQYPGDSYSFSYPESEVLYIHLLSRSLGAEIHSVGIVDSGRGALFVGVSGAGKSTMAHHWSQETDVHILSDDRVIVRRIGDGLRMYGTPWHGEAAFGSPRSGPLEQLFFLRQGATNSIRRMPASEAVPRLLMCCFATFWDPEGMAFTLSFLEDIATSVPCYELTCVNDHSVVDFVRSL